MPDDVKISTMEQFTTFIQNSFYADDYGKWVFRGHSDLAYRLVPSVARTENTSESLEKFEKSLVSMFKRQSLPFLTRYPKDDWEWLVVMQHHGLPTRLLDWTSNAYIALYFAVKGRFEKDAQFTALFTGRKISEKTTNRKSPFDIDRVYKFLPSTDNLRVHAQEGLFTVHPAPMDQIEKDLRPDWKVLRAFIPSDAKEKLVYALFRMGIHEAKLFPGIDGLSRHLVWHHQVKPAF